jgi:hypothetical protein
LTALSADALVRVAAAVRDHLRGHAGDLVIAHGDWCPASRDSAAFLDAYQYARGRRWTSQDYEACWAAGLWQRAFGAKTRLRLAGLNPSLAAEMHTT